jgi:uncharacterized protein
MAVQVSYPGVYIEEFTPGAPIEGVGTSTAAFIGTALSGPINDPTPISSWDAFVSTFGGIIVDPPLSWLGPAVFGFFLNGGTNCYIVRAGTGAMASAAIDGRNVQSDPALVATALQEGPAGNGISVQVAESSRLASALGSAVPAASITAMDADRQTLTVDDNAGYAPDMVVTVALGAESQTGMVESLGGADTIVLADPLTGLTDFTGGTVAPAGVLTVRRVETDVTAISGDRQQLIVDSVAGFAPGDRLLLDDGGGNTESATLKSTQGSDTIRLTAPVAGAVDFGGGTVRLDDLTVGQKRFRVNAPAALSLNQTLPQGTLVSITDGTNTDLGTVDAAGGDVVTLVGGLTNGYDLGSGGDFPTLASLEFDLALATETFTGLSMNRKHPGYWGTAVSSELISLSAPDEPPDPVPDDPRPAAGSYLLANGIADDRNAAWNDLTASPNDYLSLLSPLTDVSLVAVPGAIDPVVQQAVRDHCEAKFDRFAILDSVPGSDVEGIQAQFAQVRSAKGFAALYYPWISVRNPETGATELWPPSGHLAGVYARTDQTRGVHKAPANANLRGALGIERRLTNEDQGPLNLMGINVLRVFPGQAQPIVWGARTTAGDLDRNWQYVNIRRLFIFLEQSIERGIRWAVFEPNDLALWQKLKRSISEFLTMVWRGGALFGETAEQAYYVRIDEALNPPSTRALGRLYIEVGVVPTYPAEFIVLRIGIWQGGSEVSEA